MTKKGLFYFSVKDLAEIGIMVGLAIALSLPWFKIPIAVNGGSVNISMLPMFVVALRHGPFKGFLASGIVYGMITCLLDAYGINTYPMEYLIGFGTIAIYGFFAPYIIKNFMKNKTGTALSIVFTILSVVMWAVIRFFAASLDSVLFYDSTWVGGFIYNWGYITFSALFDAILMVSLLFPLKTLNTRFKTTFINEVLNTEEWLCGFYDSYILFGKLGIIYVIYL